MLQNSSFSRHKQTGSVMLEALIAILIFSIGILALVGMQATTVNNVSDAKYRSDASFLTSQIVGVIWATRTSTSNASGVVSFLPDATFACNPCTAANGNTHTQAWAASSVAGLLPGSTSAIAVSGTQVTVTLTWQPPQATAAHRHTTVAYVN
jgi:type IV pilus assembly protein PilV